MYLEWYLREKESGQKSLEERVVELLAEQNYTVTTAESCTGGLIAGTIVNAAGASEVLNEGYITYSNGAKERLVGVSHETLERFGAVSEQTAREMAEVWRSFPGKRKKRGRAACLTGRKGTASSKSRRYQRRYLSRLVRKR